MESRTESLEPVRNLTRLTDLRLNKVIVVEGISIYQRDSWLCWCFAHDNVGRCSTSGSAITEFAKWVRVDVCVFVCTE